MPCDHQRQSDHQYNTFFEDWVMSDFLQNEQLKIIIIGRDGHARCL